MRSSKWLKYWIICLLAITAILLVWHRFGMSRVLVVNHLDPNAVAAYDDREHGGKSVADVQTNPDGLLLTCQLSSRYTWPFCGVSIRFGQEPNGIDLSGYDSLLLNIDTNGRERKSVRIFLRHYDPAYSRIDDVSLLKVNELQYVPKQEPRPFLVELKKFQVASWWLNEHHIPPKYVQQDFSNVTVMEINFGDRLEPQQHQMHIRGIEFHGKWISHQLLQWIILALWVMSALVYLTATFWRGYIAMQVIKAQKAELEMFNQALRIERDELETLATRDTLTGVYNRVGLRNFLYPQLTLAKQNGWSLSAMFIDLDNYKNINDLHGHDIGDQVLVSFAKLIAKSTREQDFLCRWGGDEFILICQGTDLRAAVYLAEKLRGIIESHHWPAGVPMTCSFGVAQMDAAEDISSFIRRADEALYQSKSAGRNRVSPDLGMRDRKVVKIG